MVSLSILLAHLIYQLAESNLDKCSGDAIIALRLFPACWSDNRDSSYHGAPAIFVEKSHYYHYRHVVSYPYSYRNRRNGQSLYTGCDGRGYYLWHRVEVQRAAPKSLYS